MAEPQKAPDNSQSDLGLKGFEDFFEGQEASNQGSATVSGEFMNGQIEKLIGKMTELISLNVDQRIETARIANQLIENQRQLVATQQILIKLMDRNIELTRHIASIEEKLPALFELPAMFEHLRVKVAQLEGVELD